MEHQYEMNYDYISAMTYIISESLFQTYVLIVFNVSRVN